MWTNILLVASVALVLGFAILLALKLRHQAKTGQIVEQERRHNEYLEDQERKLRDHQVNHGRRVYNWLNKELEQYADVGIKVRKNEDNGGGFTIEIVRVHNETIYGRDPLLQLDYDFVRYKAPYQGHIHYGAYGADILIWVGNHAPLEGLDRLVLMPIREEAERRRALKAASL